MALNVRGIWGGAKWLAWVRHGMVRKGLTEKVLPADLKGRGGNPYSCLRIVSLFRQGSAGGRTSRAGLYSRGMPAMLENQQRWLSDRAGGTRGEEAIQDRLWGSCSHWQGTDVFTRGMTGSHWRIWSTGICALPTKSAGCYFENRF